MSPRDLLEVPRGIYLKANKHDVLITQQEKGFPLHLILFILKFKRSEEKQSYITLEIRII